ncbi:MAG: MFS transporter [Gemmatimonadaceae bacterium]|nr:MFS transporter [Gemmatimonadaceae bacterium]
MTERLSRNVKALGFVSLLTDIGTEMIYPLLPLFLTGVLGASGTFVGVIEGMADTTSAMLKLASGWWTDRVRHRKPLVAAGYVVSAVARPLLALATASWHVLAVRTSDRVGKGIRTSPRDALLADSSRPSQRGRAFGFHRALDNLGAVAGPLVAWLLYDVLHTGMRTVFAASAVPGALSVIVLLWFVRERTRGAGAECPGESARGAGAECPGESARGAAEEDPTGSAAGHRPAERHAAAPAADPVALPSAFWRYIAVVFIFTLGASTDAFLLLRAQQLGVPVAQIPILYAAHNLVRAASSTPGGALSDLVGRRPVIIAGWALYAAVYLAFAVAGGPWQVWVAFLAYGLFFGLTEGTEKALVADLVPARRRGTAFGWFNFAVGVAALPASVVFGLVWDRFGPAPAFTMGAALAAVAATGLWIVVPRRTLKGAAM